HASSGFVGDNPALTKPQPVPVSGRANTDRQCEAFVQLYSEPGLQLAEVDPAADQVFILDAEGWEVGRQFRPTERNPVPVPRQPRRRVDAYVRTAVIQVVPTRVFQ